MNTLTALLFRFLTKIQASASLPTASLGSPGSIFINQFKQIEIFQVSKKIVAKIGTPQALIQDLFINPASVSEKLGKLTPKERKELSLGLQQEVVGQAQFSTLSSSWIMSGTYEPIGIAGAGNLTIQTKDGKSYLYPNVPLQVWEAMRAATGTNGSGAGTVFWALFLRGAKVSAQQQQIQTAFQLAGARK